MRKKRAKKRITMQTPAFINEKNVVVIGSTLAALVLVALALVLWVGLPKSGPAPTTFDECAKLYKVTGTMPETCTVPWGRTFVQYDGNANTPAGDAVRLDLPPAAVFNHTPVTVAGTAKADWFGPQGLDIKLVVGTGAVLVETYAQTAPAGTPAPEGSKAFSTQLSFPPQPPGSQGAVIITKPGGSQSLVTPIVF